MALTNRIVVKTLHAEYVCSVHTLIFFVSHELLHLFNDDSKTEHLFFILEYFFFYPTAIHIL